MKCKIRSGNIWTIYLRLRIWTLDFHKSWVYHINYVGEHKNFDDLMHRSWDIGFGNEHLLFGLGWPLKEIIKHTPAFLVDKFYEKISLWILFEGFPYFIPHIFNFGFSFWIVWFIGNKSTWGRVKSRIGEALIKIKAWIEVLKPPLLEWNWKNLNC